MKFSRKKVFFFVLPVFAFWFLFPKPDLWGPYSFSQAIYDRDGKLLRLTLSQDEKFRLRIPLKEISPLLLKATLLKEDRYFYWHVGMNPVSLLRAFLETAVTQKKRTGASTITMQVARLRFGLKTRTLTGKIEQILRALQLEWHYSKEEIFEAYLTLAPYGANIEGVAAASLIYFDKGQNQLSLAEALTLAVIPQMPGHRTPKGSQLNHNPLLAEARKELYQTWVKKYPLDQKQKSSLELDLKMTLRDQLPFRAPHFVNRLMQTYPHRAELHTTLDVGLQEILERQASQYVAQKKNLGIQNVSALMIDSRDMSVKGLLGSVDFFNKAIEGQVNGTLSKRSPGSALKPFIYALGMDQGVIHPMTMLKDSPMSFGEYSPENFDGKFSGPIKARLALIYSRNLPAIFVANKLSRPTFYEFLRKAHVAQLREEDFYGLALVLGGVEVTMEELTSMYAMLANDGVLKPLRWLKAEKISEGETLLSPEASFLTLDILKGNPRPSSGLRPDWMAAKLPVYWKTGTSYAFRDAWSVGIFGPYVLGVWVGNFNGEGNPAFVGLETAAPLMFRMIDAITAQDKNLADRVQPLRYAVKRSTVCSASGQIPTPHCPHSTTTWFIPGKSPIGVCQIHREVQINTRSGLATCQASPQTRKEVFEFWPSDLLKIFQMAGIPRRTPPPFEAACHMDSRAQQGTPPEITSPKRGIVYQWREPRQKSDTIAFMAVADADVAEIHWFLNESYLGSAKAKESFFWSPKPGRYIVRAVDDQGRADATPLTVRLDQ